jgi:hypothetical protein
MWAHVTHAVKSPQTKTAYGRSYCGQPLDSRDMRGVTTSAKGITCKRCLASLTKAHIERFSKY